jgi:positive regulator of sigma E activity
VILVLQIAAGVFLGHVALTAFSFYMGRHYAKKHRAAEEAGMKLLEKIAAESPSTKEERKANGGQYL